MFFWLLLSLARPAPVWKLLRAKYGLQDGHPSGSQVNQDSTYLNEADFSTEDIPEYSRKELVEESSTQAQSLQTIQREDSIPNEESDIQLREWFPKFQQEAKDIYRIDLILEDGRYRLAESSGDQSRGSVDTLHEGLNDEMPSINQVPDLLNSDVKSDNPEADEPERAITEVGTQYVRIPILKEKLRKKKKLHQGQKAREKADLLSVDMAIDLEDTLGTESGKQDFVGNTLQFDCCTQIPTRTSA